MRVSLIAEKLIELIYLVKLATESTKMFEISTSCEIYAQKVVPTYLD